jgi:uncharacterized protein YutE (UPF0331/DUF86 family)
MDKERILVKIDEMNQFIRELESITPESFEEYEENIEIKRACERLLQILIECVIDICMLLVKELKLGLPSGEEDIFEKLHKNGIISAEMKNILKKMKGFRNILVHRYAEVNDEIVFENLKLINDFRKFQREILEYLKRCNE